jgi:hypothetical protein
MSRMSDDEARRAAVLSAVPPEYREQAKRLFDAERRVERGIGVRMFNIGYKDSSIRISISDELAVIARDGIRSAVEYSVSIGDAMTGSQLCRIGLGYLREMVAAGRIDNRNLWGTARLALMRLYDDMVLRRFRPWDGEQIYTPVEFTNSEPPNEYWLMLHDDDENFNLVFEKPLEWAGLIAIDETHYSTKH